MRRTTLEALLALSTRGDGAALVKDLITDQECLVSPTGSSGELALDASLVARARAAIVADRCETVSSDTGKLFIHVFNSPSRLIVVGAVHITEALAPMAALAGYAVTIVDPRRAFRERSSFAAYALSDDWPDRALERLRPDRRTAVVALSHDPKVDDPALVAAIRSDAFYVGALGSRKSHAKRRDRLAALGIDERDFGRIHGPVGLAIGALTPAEIAISIVAEMIQVKRQGKSQ